MTKHQSRLRRNFFKQCGPNIKTMAAIFESLPNIGFYIKDAEGHIIAINRFNCEMCNLPNPDFAIGKRSSDLFPQSFADFCMARDSTVRKTGKPIVNRRYTKVANMSVGARVLSLYPAYDRGGEIIGTLCCYYCDKPDNAGPIWEDKFDAIIASINDNISKPLSLNKLATDHGMSVSNLQRMFMRIIGVRPGKYIIQQRLNAACRHLENTDLGIHDIAMATGFCDQSHFTKIFKRERGITPGEYRRKHRAMTTNVPSTPTRKP
jgi:AraC-like DNA-binding protein